jgi:hypothetical protein
LENLNEEMRRRLAEKDGLIREEKGIVSDLKNQL